MYFSQLRMSLIFPIYSSKLVVLLEASLQIFDICYTMYTKIQVTREKPNKRMVILIARATYTAS